MIETALYAHPRVVTDLSDCYFYHTMEVPGFGRVKGEWDLRGKEAEYLGGISFKGKRVLEIGTASGFLCFYMERQGGEVVAYDLSPDEQWDVVPFSGTRSEEYRREVQESKEHIRRLNNGYWLAHRANQSRARVVYGSVYDIPDEIGEVDVSVFGSVLLHFRDPLLALQKAATLTRQTIVVTDLSSTLMRLFEFMQHVAGIGLPLMAFKPDYKARRHPYTWWHPAPSVVRSFLAILGFEESRISYSKYSFQGRTKDCYTLVANRPA